MEVPRHEDHADMVEDQQRERTDPQPVHAVMPRHRAALRGGERCRKRARAEAFPAPVHAFMRGVPMKSRLPIGTPCARRIA